MPKVFKQASVDPDAMLEEVRASTMAKDAIKVRLVLDHLAAVDRTVQNRLIYELSRADARFTIPMLNYLVTEYPDLSNSLPVLRETLLSQLLGHPELIVDCLEDPTIKCKQILVQTAGELRLPEAVPALVALLGQTDEPDEIQQVVEVMGMIGGDSVINTLTEFLYSADRDLTIQAVEALHQVGTPVAMDCLAGRMGTDNELDMLILRVFGDVQDTTSLQKLNETIRSPHTRMRVLAKEQLAAVGEVAVPMLVANLEGTNSDMLVHTLNVLADIRDAHAVAPIRKLLTSDPEDANVRFAAYETLAQLPLQKGAYALAAGLTDREDHVCIAAARAIERNLNDLLVAGIKNLVRKEDAEARHIVKTIINAQVENLFLALIGEEFVQRLALVYLPHAHDDVRENYLRILNENGYERFVVEVAGSQPGSVTANRLKICAVDDSRVILSIYKATLHELGFEPVLFEFPSSAIQWLEHEKPAMVLTDLNMPKISGLELAEEIRKKYSQQELPVIMVTTQSDAKDRGAADAAGINEILAKPFDADMLRAAMGRYIPVG